ncbi:hypothetical protein STCU_12071 [Strigomonas culicis]|uniref:Uncharacterized protein n=1 Tax=Strigomonas culicis TaxID=28005 RepID=S9TBI4_9TRYP|nr:hypothetical protein STCU_12071 [Strigomonas culicis]|eukprot:EPY15377.1 hypothetical protein STCU_12071 [Strigomonas culicis]
MGAEEQFHLGRYADVVAGAPGPFSALALFMDLAPAAAGACRTWLTFAPYAPREERRADQAIAEAVGAAYALVLPRDVVLAGAVLDDLERRGKSLAEGKAELRAPSAHTQRLPGLQDQTAMYNMTEIEERLEEAYARVRQCLAA